MAAVNFVDDRHEESAKGFQVCYAPANATEDD